MRWSPDDVLDEDYAKEFAPVIEVQFSLAGVFLKSSMMHSGDGVPSSAVGASAGRGPGSMHRAAIRLGQPALIPCAITGRSPEALAFGSRCRLTIAASPSLSRCGCLLIRSCDGSRSRVPPRFPPRRYADAPAAASFFRLRLAWAFSLVTGRARKLEAPRYGYHHRAAGSACPGSVQARQG
jgi:hypothetical protein